MLYPVKDRAIENRSKLSVKEKGQYALAFSVVAVMLYFVGFPVFLLFFFGVLTFFIWKAFSAESRNSVSPIFEFYLTANEMLKRDGRRWFGFELAEAIAKGEQLVASTQTPPPLVYFTLGALYQKAGDHPSAVKYLATAAGESPMDESLIVQPTPELQEYVRLLRRIERSPTEAPVTAAAVRSLERLRDSRSAELLELSRSKLAASPLVELPPGTADQDETAAAYNFAEFAKNRKRKTGGDEEPERQSISEVLREIYDETAER